MELDQDNIMEIETEKYQYEETKYEEDILNLVDEDYEQDLEPLEEMNDEESSTIEDFLVDDDAENQPLANTLANSEFDDVIAEDEDEPTNDNDFEEINSHQVACQQTAVESTIQQF